MSKTPKKVDLEGKGGSDQFFNTFSMFREPISLIYEFSLFLDWVPLNKNNYYRLILQKQSNLEAEIIFSEFIHTNVSFLTYGASFPILKVLFVKYL